MPQYEIDVPGSGKYRIDSPTDLTDDQVWMAVQGQIKPQAAEKPSKERTWGESVKDIGAGAVSGIGSLLQTPGQVAGLFTGDLEKTGLMGKGAELQQYGEEMKSAGLKAREQERAQKIAQAAEKGQLSAFGTAFGETIKDPGLLLNFLAEQAPQMVVPLGAGKAGTAIGAARGLGAEAAAAAGTRAAVGAGAVQQGADVGAGTYEQIYQELMERGAKPEQAKAAALNLARASGASGAVISLLAQKLPGATNLERALAGAERKGSRLGTSVGAVAGEIPSEITEETGGKFTQNLAMREVNPEQSLTEGLGETAGMATLGAVGMGSAAGLMGKSPSAAAAPTPEADIDTGSAQPPAPTPPGLPGLPAPEEQAAIGVNKFPLLEGPEFTQEQIDAAAALAEQEQQAVAQEKAATLPGMTGRPTTNADMIAAAKATQSEEQKAEEDQRKKNIKMVLAKTYSADPLQNALQKQRDLEALGVERTKASDAVVSLKPDLNYQELQDAISKAEINDRKRWSKGFTTGWKPEELEAMGIQKPAKAAPIDRSSNLDNIGVAGELITEGGTHFGTREEAADARKKSKLTDYVVAKTPEGYVLSPKSAEEIAAQDKNNARLAAASVGKKGMPMAAHEFITSEGGLNFNQRSETQFLDENPQVGNRTLFQSRGKSIDEATESLIQAGYLPEDATTNDAIKLIEDSFKAPKYTPEGTERIGEMALEEERTAAEKQEAKESLTSPLFEEIGYAKAPENIAEEAETWLDYAKKQGIDTSTITERADEETRGQPDDEYHKKVIENVKKELGSESEAFESKKKLKGFNTTDENRRVEKELKGKSLLQVAQWAVRNAPNAFARHFAQKSLERIQSMSDRGIVFKFEILSGSSRPISMRGATGKTSFIWSKDPGGTEIQITLNGATVVENQPAYPPGTSYETVFHELLHVATRGQFKFMRSTDPLVIEMNDLYQKVYAEYKRLDKEGKLPEILENFKNDGNNCLLNADEMLSWSMTDKDMQKFMSSVKVGEATAFEKIVQFMREILGAAKPFESALDRLVKTADSILDVEIETVAKGVEKEGYLFGSKKPIKSMRGATQQSLFSKSVQKMMEEEDFESKKKITEAIDEGYDKVKKAVHKAAQTRKLDEGAFAGIDESYFEDLGKTFAPEQKTILDRIEGMRDDFWKKLAQRTADQFRSIKDYSPLGYIQARMSKSVDGGLEGLMFYGQVINDGGALNVKKNTKGLIEIMKPIGEEVDRFQIWVALNRESNLPADKRSPQLTKLVSRRNDLVSGELNGKSRKEVYEQVQKQMRDLNNSVLDVAFGVVYNEKGKIVKSEGLHAAIIDKEAYNKFKEDNFYIPFYRAMEDGDTEGAKTASGLVNQKFSEALKGGNGEKAFGDLMENRLRNWSHILSASMKNQAAVTTINDALKLNGAEPNLKSGFSWRDGKVVNSKSGQMIGNGELKAEYTEKEAGAVKIMVDGQPMYFNVTNPLLMESITSIGYMGPKGVFVDVAKDFKNILQYGVTISPNFKVANLFRDSVQSAAVSGLKKNIVANMYENWGDSARGKPAYISALAGGGIFNFGSYYEGNQAKLIKDLIKQGVKREHILDDPTNIKLGLKMLWEKYEDLGNRSEAVNRIALYKKLRSEGMSHLEAAYQARDLLDFSMQGSSSAFRYLTQIIPFFNARVQGLYKLGRDGIMPTSRVFYNTVTGKEIDQTDKQKAESFTIVSSAVMMASIMLYLTFKDDEEFQKRDQWDRDNFWWIKLPGMDFALRIPKPFEIGALGTIAERTLEQMVDEGAEGKMFSDTLKRMMTDTFAVNLPQIFKPLVDIYANKDSFSGSPIESAGMETLSKEERKTDTTSPLAIALGGVANLFLPEKAEMSPVQAEYLIKSYVGWLGGTAAAASQYAVMPFREGEYPDANWTNRVSLGLVRSLPSNQSSYVTSFYENNKAIQEAFADMRHYAEVNDSEKVQEILEEKGDKIALAKFYQKTSKNMANVRKQIRMVTEDTEMDGTSKREEIDRLKEIISMMAKQAEETRKSMK